MQWAVWFNYILVQLLCQHCSKYSKLGLLKRTQMKEVIMLTQIKGERATKSSVMAGVFGYIHCLWLLIWKIILYPLEKVFKLKTAIENEVDQLNRHMPTDAPARERKMADLEALDTDQSKAATVQEMCGSVEGIEVIHERQVPKLHGILKQRSLSESSDDLNIVYTHQLSIESIVSESDENVDYTSGDDNVRERKKSVSFSEQVDSTIFKQNQSVNSMKHTLKNKRKKQRRNEKRQHGRRRRNSNSVSELSGDEMLAEEHSSYPSEDPLLNKSIDDVLCGTAARITSRDLSSGLMSRDAAARVQGLSAKEMDVRSDRNKGIQSKNCISRKKLKGTSEEIDTIRQNCFTNPGEALKHFAFDQVNFVDVENKIKTEETTTSVEAHSEEVHKNVDNVKNRINEE